MTDQDPTQQFTPPPEPPSTPAGAEPRPGVEPTPAAPAQPTPAQPAPESAAAAAAVPASAPPVPAAAPAADATAPYAPPAPVPPAPPAAGAVPTFLPPQAAGDAVATAPVVARPAPKKGRSPVKWVVAARHRRPGRRLGRRRRPCCSPARRARRRSSPGPRPTASPTPRSGSTSPATSRPSSPRSCSAFPGFDDQAAFPTKINEVLDQLVGKASDGKQSYTADIQPWFGGQLGVSVGPLPTGRRRLVGALPRPRERQGRRQGQRPGRRRTLQEAGATSTTETYNGVTITVIKPRGRRQRAWPRSVQLAYAVIGPVLAIGDTSSVKAAIDTGGKTGLNTNEQFKAASATITGDRLAFAYVDTEAIVTAAVGDGPGRRRRCRPPRCPRPRRAVPGLVGRRGPRRRTARFVVESRQPHNEKLGPAPNAASTLPSLVPPTPSPSSTATTSATR